MPRKYQDNQLVAVYYATRRMAVQFLGVVQKYDSGKYYVRYISGDRASSYDRVFECHTKELREPCNAFIDDTQASQLQVYHNYVKNRTERSPHRHYANDDDRIVWASFAAKRILGSHFYRNFPVTQMVWRTDYVY